MWVRSTGVPSGARRVLPRGRERSKRACTGVIHSGLSRAVSGRSRPLLHTLGNLLRDHGRHRRARWGRGADYLSLQFCRGSSDGSGSLIMRLRSPRPCGPRDECGSQSCDFLRDRSSFGAAIPVDRAALRGFPNGFFTLHQGG
ncbi:hypothetical protein NDU88_002676 [Pleurodeles waltl]|uniref:Uncharacterized protein n=1 Tax=Pleurodeles waltl TaxID=8319 RepID=A0AAV7UAF7_PLEWA|nr:hypothetical protein NDU88_002676 [Pleurodeles waltl]